MTMNPFGSPLVRGGASVPAPSSRYILPQFEERTSYGMKRLDPYTKMFEDRIIFLGVQVDDASADDIIAQLIVLESQDPDRDILMYINSPGGSFTAMTAIYDTMQYIRPDIQTFVVGQAASAAAVLTAAGARASGSRCRTRGSSSTSPRWAAVTTARPPTSRSRPTRCFVCVPGSRRRWPAHRAYPGAGQRGHRARQDPVRGGRRGIRPHRRGPAVPQELAGELTIGSTARR